MTMNKTLHIIEIVARIINKIKMYQKLNQSVAKKPKQFKRETNFKQKAKRYIGNLP